MWAFQQQSLSTFKEKTWAFQQKYLSIVKAKTWAFQQQFLSPFKWQNRGFHFSFLGFQMQTHTGMAKTPFSYQDTNYKNADREMILIFHCQDTNTMQT
jgi:hypothetical protein